MSTAPAAYAKKKKGSPLPGGLRKSHRVLGGFQIFTGFCLIGLGIAGQVTFGTWVEFPLKVPMEGRNRTRSFVTNPQVYLPSTSGLWCGLFFVITGSVSATAGRKLRRPLCCVGTGLLFSLLAMLLSAMIVIFAFLPPDGMWLPLNMDLVYACVGVALFEFLLAFCHSICSCRACCCPGKRQLDSQDTEADGGNTGATANNNTNNSSAVTNNTHINIMLQPAQELPVNSTAAATAPFEPQLPYNFGAARSRQSYPDATAQPPPPPYMYNPDVPVPQQPYMYNPGYPVPQQPNMYNPGVNGSQQPNLCKPDVFGSQQQKMYNPDAFGSQQQKMYNPDAFGSQQQDNTGFTYLQRPYSHGVTDSKQPFNQDAFGWQSLPREADSGPWL